MDATPTCPSTDWTLSNWTCSRTVNPTSCPTGYVLVEATSRWSCTAKRYVLTHSLTYQFSDTQLYLFGSTDSKKCNYRTAILNEKIVGNNAVGTIRYSYECGGLNFLSPTLGAEVCITDRTSTPEIPHCTKAPELFIRASFHVDFAVSLSSPSEVLLQTVTAGAVDVGTPGFGAELERFGEASHPITLTSVITVLPTSITVPSSTETVTTLSTGDTQVSSSDSSIISVNSNPPRCAALAGVDFNQSANSFVTSVTLRESWRDQVTADISLGNDRRGYRVPRSGVVRITLTDGREIPGELLDTVTILSGPPPAYLFFLRVTNGEFDVTYSRLVSITPSAGCPSGGSTTSTTTMAPS